MKAPMIVLSFDGLSKTPAESLEKEKKPGKIHSYLQLMQSAAYKDAYTKLTDLTARQIATNRF